MSIPLNKNIRAVSYNGTNIPLVGGEPTLQDKTVTPSALQQVVSADPGYDGLDEVTVNGDANLAAGNIKSGVSIFGVSGSYAPASTIQVYSGRGTVGGTTLAKSGVKLTVAQTGVYTVTWMSARSYASGTSGSKLYIDGVGYGTEFTSFTETNNNNVCYCTLTNVSLTAGQEIEVWARGSTSTRYTTIGNLILQKTS